MKKSISLTKRCFTVLLAVLIASLTLITAYAENSSPDQSEGERRDTYVIGDADVDRDVTILDATAIQRYLAELSNDHFDEKAADVDGMELSILDAAYIQRFLAGLSDPYDIGDTAAVPKSRTGFSDVAVCAWYEDAVDWAVDNGIAQGIGDGLFGVGQALTQAQMDEMLRRAAGLAESEETSAQPVDRLTAVTAIWEQFSDGETAECPFADVTEHAGAVGWAFEKDIVTGEPGGDFRPEEIITREEFVTMLYRCRWQADGFIDRNVGVFREKLTDETAKVRYFSDLRSVAYMSLADYYAIMLPGYQMQTEPAGDGKYTLTSACGTATIHFLSKTFGSALFQMR